MAQIEITPQQAILYGTLFQVGIGLVLGLCPLILGFLRKNITYGVIGLIASIVGGALLGVFLSVPAAAIFTWLIIRGSKIAVVIDTDGPAN